MATNTVNINKIDGLIIKVKMTKEFMIRKFVAINLIRLAAIVLGGAIQIDTEGRGD